MKRTTIHITVDPALKAKAQAAAKAQGRSLAGYLQQLVREDLKRGKR